VRVLVACEYSGIVRDAFLARGHNAMSCDILPTESPGPHYQGDVRDVLYEDWDMVIAHPPCTYLSKAGARWMYPSAGVVCSDRYDKAMQAREFFMLFLSLDTPKVAIENPTPLKVAELPLHSQAIQPYEFGEPYSKRTLLWLKGLPPLRPTDILDTYQTYLPSNTGGKKKGQKYNNRSISQKEASRFFKGVAAAMAEQWSDAQPPPQP